MSVSLEFVMLDEYIFADILFSCNATMSYAQGGLVIFLSLQYSSLLYKKRQTKRRMLLKRSQTFVKRDALHIKKVFCRFLITEKNEIDIEIK